MPCYGINFGFPSTPGLVAKKLPALKRVGESAKKVTLQGVCNTLDELHRMKIQANNGVRTIHAEGPFTIAGELWWGIWTS